jgi:hypothetical protein
MSAAAAGLLRALLCRGGVARDRILLTELRSIEWQSLTFVGERHLVTLRLPGPDSADILNRLTLGIEEAEFGIPGHLVADIALVGSPVREDDGAVLLNLEALTIAE